MRPARFIHGLVLAAGLVSAACTGGGSSLARSSWEVSLPLTVTSMQRPFPLSCSALTFTMHLEPQAVGLDATLGYNGRVTSGQLVPKDGAYELVAPLPLPGRTECGEASFGMTRLSLHAADGSGDGVADLISGQGDGTGTMPLDDEIYRFAFSFELSGTPDVTRPTLIAPGMLHPLDGVRLAASEALAPSSQLSLQGSPSVSLQADGAGVGPIGILLSDRILPFSGTWTVMGAAEDLIGLPIETGIQVTSLTDPGLFAEDGFEGATLAATLTGSAQVVSNVGSLPALSGGKSLQVSIGSSATLHLARPPGATTVRLVSRSLRTPSYCFFGGLGIGGVDPPPVTVGVIGGVSRPRPEARSTGVSVAVQDSPVNYAGPPQEVSVPLDEPGSDVVVRIAPPINLNGTYCYPAGVLIDDLRVE